MNPVVKNMTVESACQHLVLTTNKSLRTSLIQALSLALIKLRMQRKVLGRALGTPEKPTKWLTGARRVEVARVAALVRRMVKQVECALRVVFMPIPVAEPTSTPKLRAPAKATMRRSGSAAQSSVWADRAI